MPKDQQDKEASDSHRKLHPLLDPAKRKLIESNLEKVMKAYSSGDPQLIDQVLEEMPGIKKLREEEAKALRAQKEGREK